MQKDTCRFCIKTKAGHHCLLYDQSLKTDEEFIYKVRDCCRATAGFASSIEEPPPAPVVNPQELVAEALDMYEKTVNELVKQHYPRGLAESVARRHLTGK